jgi:hypothetical protein
VKKEELIYLTLRQLKDSLKTSPQNFRIEDPELGSINGGFHGPTIIWQFKVEIKPGEFITDPLNATKTVIVTHNRVRNEITCLIYFREVNAASSAMMPETQAVFKLHKWSFINRTYRQFESIRKDLIKMRRQKEYVDYLQKLNKIFPSTHEEDLFK